MTPPPFDPDVLRRFRRLLLTARRRGGVGRGPAGITRLDRRDYAPGDDYRHVDWRLSARRDELLTRTFTYDEDVPTYVLLDCSASMAIGNPPKFHLARTIAALAAYQALAGLRRCGVSAFAGRVVADLPAIRGPSRVGSVMRFLANLSPQGRPTDLARTAGDFVRRYQPHGTVVVITDCYDRAGFPRGLQILRARGYEPALVHLYAPCEADPGLLGDVELFDVETERGRRVTVTERVAARYRRHFGRFCGSVRGHCSRLGVACLQVASDAREDGVLRSVLGLAPAERSSARAWVPAAAPVVLESL